MIRFTRRVIRGILWRVFPGMVPKALRPVSRQSLSRLSDDELLGLMRHNSHRIEKAVYNRILETKRAEFQSRHQLIALIHEILAARGFPMDEPSVAWSCKITECFGNLEEGFIRPNSSPTSLSIDLSKADRLIECFRRRRSIRVWAEAQPDEGTLLAIARRMIDAARWAPNSGNRQTWRFRTIVKEEERLLLRKIKEYHCVSAPLSVFVGMDGRLYGALGERESCMYIDAGAAIMQMMLTAHESGFGTCWNHFAEDLVCSRERNKKIYREFAEKLNIPEHIRPVAVVSVGVPRFIPPVPARMAIERLTIHPAENASARA